MQPEARVDGGLPVQYQPVRKDGNKTCFDWTEEMPALFVDASDRAEAMDWLQSYQKDLKIVR